MNPGPAFVAQKIFAKYPLDHPPRRIVELITEIILEEGWEISSAIAREKAESWESRVFERLRNLLNEWLDLGRPVRIEFNSSSQYLVQGSCFVQPSDSNNLKQKKLRRLQSERVHSVFANLTPDQFETLCAKIIGLFGVENPIVTRKSADEGIDFYGKLSLESIFFPQDLTPTIQKQLSVWMVGQAKRYLETSSGTKEVRELVGAITLGKVDAIGSEVSPFPDLEIRVAEPVFSLFFTTGVISANAWRLLRNSGVIGMDGEMVAAFLADRGVGVNESGDFNEDEFLQWLDE